MDELTLSLRFQPVPDNAVRFAELARSTASEVSGLALDYSGESLGLVDDLVERLRASSSVESVGETLFALGCYVGETLLRNLCGKWVDRSKSALRDYSRWPLVIEMEDGHSWNPIGKVFKRFEEGEAESLAYFFEVVKQSARPSQ